MGTFQIDLFLSAYIEPSWLAVPIKANMVPPFIPASGSGFVVPIWVVLKPEYETRSRAITVLESIVRALRNDCRAAKRIIGITIFIGHFSLEDDRFDRLVTMSIDCDGKCYRSTIMETALKDLENLKNSTRSNLLHDEYYLTWDREALHL